MTTVPRMTRPLPLAAARERLARRPGRPRKHPPAPPDPPAPPLNVPNVDTAIPARLLDVRAAAAYLSVSPWTFRTLVDNGMVPRVRVRLDQHGAELRKILVDRQDLDRLVETWREDRP